MNKCFFESFNTCVHPSMACYGVTFTISSSFNLSFSICSVEFSSISISFHHFEIVFYEYKIESNSHESSIQIKSPHNSLGLNRKQMFIWVLQRRWWRQSLAYCMRLSFFSSLSFSLSFSSCIFHFICKQLNYFFASFRFTRHSFLFRYFSVSFSGHFRWNRRKLWHVHQSEIFDTKRLQTDRLTDEWILMCWTFDEHFTADAVILSLFSTRFYFIDLFLW